MSCNRQALSEYFDGELTGEQREAVELHLKECDECNAVLLEYRRVSQAIRAIPSQAIPPMLSEDIGNRVAANRQSLLRRWRGPAMGLGTAMAAALVTVILISNIMQGGTPFSNQTQHSATPVIRTAKVATNSSIKITFDRSMDEKTVESAIQISPSLPVDYMWYNNDLFLVPKETLQPSTTYVVAVKPSAKDSSGHSLRSNYSLEFTTNEEKAIRPPSKLNTPTGVPSNIAVVAMTTPISTTLSTNPATTITAVAMQASTKTAMATTRTVTSTNSPTVPAVKTTSTTPVKTATLAITNTALATKKPNATSTSQNMVQPTATTTSATAVTLATPTTRFTATTAMTPPTTNPSATLAITGQTTPTETLNPASVPIAEPTLIMTTPTHTPTPVEPSAVTAVFTPIQSLFQLYNDSIKLQEQLGQPIEDERFVLAVEQPFENGLMFWREDLKLIYVLKTDGTVNIYDDLWQDGMAESSALTPPDGLIEPANSLGLVWREVPSVRASIGWAIDKEHGFITTVQTFDRGTLCSTDEKQVLVIQKDNRWESITDVSQDQ